MTDDRELVAAARILLQRMSVDPADLMADPVDRPRVPTLAEYIPQVQAAVSLGTAAGTGHTGSGSARSGARSLLEPSPTEVEQFTAEIKANAVDNSGKIATTYSLTAAQVVTSAAATIGPSDPLPCPACKGTGLSTRPPEPVWIQPSFDNRALISEPTNHEQHP